MKHPMIIQGGMGAGVSNWKLAKAVSRAGYLGVVSGTALDQIFARKLQTGDPEGVLRKAMKHFPDQEMTQKIMETFFIPDGKPETQPFKTTQAISIHPDRLTQELLMVANFSEVFLAKEGHEGIIGINLLEKIPCPNLYSLYGAMLAGVDYVIMGAGIPRDIPGILDRLAFHQNVSLKIPVDGSAPGDDCRAQFDPGSFFLKKPPVLKRPEFLCIISSAELAKMMFRKASGKVNGFIVEDPSAGGHNAPPRGQLKLNEKGEPVYGQRDVVNLETIKSIGLPFWLAGSYGSPKKLKSALAEGAQGIQVGTAFAFSKESGFSENLKNEIVQKITQGNLSVYTDPKASPTGFPFKILLLEGSLSEAERYHKRKRVCDLGYLRHPYKKPNGLIGYRCPSEQEDAYIKKYGKLEDTRGKKCLCNALLANIGLAQIRKSGYMEEVLVTLGDDLQPVSNILKNGSTSYSAQDVLNYLLKDL